MTLLSGLGTLHVFGMGFTACAIYSDPNWGMRWPKWKSALGILFWEVTWGHGLFMGLVRGDSV